MRAIRVRAICEVQGLRAETASASGLNAAGVRSQSAIEGGLFRPWGLMCDGRRRQASPALRGLVERAGLGGADLLASLAKLGVSDAGVGAKSRTHFPPYPRRHILLRHCKYDSIFMKAPHPSCICPRLHVLLDVASVACDSGSRDSWLQWLLAPPPLDTYHFLSAVSAKMVLAFARGLACASGSQFYGA